MSLGFGRNNDNAHVRREMVRAGETVSGSTYFDAVDHTAVSETYPVTDLVRAFSDVSRDELRSRQERQLLHLVDFGWRVPFYAKRWRSAGLAPGDVRGLDDLALLPTYTKADLMASVAEHPPLGDFHGLDGVPQDARPPLVFHTTSGTTGTPQPLLWGPRGREIQNLLLARLYALQGMTRADVVHSVYGFGLVNGGHYVREAIQHWIGAQVLSAGTGAETRSVQQVRVMRDFQATVLVGFGDYLRKLADVAHAEGLAPGEDIRIRMISGHLGVDGAAKLAAAWGVEDIFDWYGVGDTGAIAGEGPDRAGMHILEDAHLIEVLDPQSSNEVGTGSDGEIVCTCLYKDDVFPVIRFRTQDVTRILPGENPLGLPFRRMAGHLGRADNMIKLRGVTVYPHGIGTLLGEAFGIQEYICKVASSDGGSDVTVLAEARQPEDGLACRIEELLRARLGVRIAVEVVAPGATAELTELDSRQKPRRLIHE